VVTAAVVAAGGGGCAGGGWAGGGWAFAARTVDIDTAAYERLGHHHLRYGR
jgi:hypothetical protein